MLVSEPEGRRLITRRSISRFRRRNYSRRNI